MDGQKLPSLPSNTRKSSVLTSDTLLDGHESVFAVLLFFEKKKHLFAATCASRAKA
jgi:hypothetical protein